MFNRIKLLRTRALHLFGALLVAATFVVSSSASYAAGEVRIAVNGPLTGPIALIFVDYTKGLQMGLDDASKRLGVPRDTFALDMQDAGDPKSAVTVVKKHLLNPVDVYISGYSNQSKAIAPELDRAGVTHFMISFDAFLARENENRLRIFPNYKLEGPLYIDYIKTKKAKKIAVIGLNFASIDEQFAKIVEPAFEGTDVKFMREMYDFNTKDYNTLALKAARFKPDLTIITGFAFQVYPFLKAVRTYVKTGEVITTMDFIDLLYKDIPTSELAGTVFASPHFELPGVIPALGAWKDRYKAAIGTVPTYASAYAYDTAQIIVEAYKKKGKVNTKTIRGVTPYTGLIGKIELDADGDIIGSLGIGQVNADRSVKVLQQ
jgi:branched-chain amino acid transport system substrate-binding protein